jgi:hypothetical protein
MAVELGSVSEWSERLGQVIVAMRGLLLALPSRLAGRAAHCANEAEIERLLDDEIRETLVELSKPFFSEEEPSKDRNGECVPAVPADDDL